MNPLFAHTGSSWVRYSAYEWKSAADSSLYLTPKEGAQPQIYDPLKDGQQLVADALNLGRLCMGQKPDAQIQAAMLRFAESYGLLGLMTALPTTTRFMDYAAVYLPKNPFIKAESMDTIKYLSLFFPFEKPEVAKRGIESLWNLRGDKAMQALALTMADRPLAVNMGFQRAYAERYDWLQRQFSDWAFLFSTCFLYYEDYESIDEDTLALLRRSMAAFDGNAPSYHIALLDRPTLVWDFHSLLLAVQMMLSFLLTEEKTPLRLCRHCTRVFVASRPGNEFCSHECKNRHNVYKSRARKKDADASARP